LEQLKLEKQRFELRAGELPDNAAYPRGQLEAAGMLGRGLEKAGKARAEVGGAADVGLRVGFRTVESEDGWALRQLG
jgi:hypothetical protein